MLSWSDCQMKGFICCETLCFNSPRTAYRSSILVEHVGLEVRLFQWWGERLCWWCSYVYVVLYDLTGDLDWHSHLADANSNRSRHWLSQQSRALARCSEIRKKVFFFFFMKEVDRVRVVCDIVCHISSYNPSLRTDCYDGTHSLSLSLSPCLLLPVSRFQKLVNAIWL